MSLLFNLRYVLVFLLVVSAELNIKAVFSREKKMTEKSLHKFIAQKEMEAFIREEVQRQTQGILRKCVARNEVPEAVELMPARDDQNDSGVADVDSVASTETQETAVLIKDCSKPLTEQTKKCLEITVDSLLDVHVERIRRDVGREETRRFRNGRHRYWNELYCCYGIYFLMLFWVFLFAVLHVWMPILKGIKGGKPNATQIGFKKYH